MNIIESCLFSKYKNRLNNNFTNHTFFIWSYETRSMWVNHVIISNLFASIHTMALHFTPAGINTLGRAHGNCVWSHWVVCLPNCAYHLNFLFVLFDYLKHHNNSFFKNALQKPLNHVRRRMFWQRLIISQSLYKNIKLITNSIDRKVDQKFFDNSPNKFQYKHSFFI